MRIANPLYDAVIKFLLEDNAVAKDFLSVLLDKQIVSLDLKPQEVTLKTKEGISVLRFDFKAVIKTKSNKLEKVLIEIQKSKSGFQLSRFRQYLGLNYINDEDLVTGKQGKNRKGILPILTVYILGFEIPSMETPILKIERVYKDLVDGKIIEQRHKYIETLTHDSLIIQIPRLKMETQTAREKVLDIFNEVKYKTDNPHFLEYTGDTNNPVVELMLKRLNLAIADPDVLHAILVEQEIEKTLAKQRKKMEKSEKKAKKNEEKALKYEEEAQINKEEARINKEEARINKEEARINKEKYHKSEEDKKAIEAKAIEAEKAKEKAFLEIELLKKQLEDALKQNKP